MPGNCDLSARVRDATRFPRALFLILSVSLIVLDCRYAAATEAQSVPASGENAQSADQPLGIVSHGNSPPVVNGTAISTERGNTTIIFEPAGNRNLGAALYQRWDEFASTHVPIARAIARKPALAKDPQFLRKHPELESFYAQHPDVRDALIADPGNFEAIPPRPGE